MSVYVRNRFFYLRIKTAKSECGIHLNIRRQPYNLGRTFLPLPARGPYWCSIFSCFSIDKKK